MGTEPLRKVTVQPAELYAGSEPVTEHLGAEPLRNVTVQQPAELFAGFESVSQ